MATKGIVKGIVSNLVTVEVDGPVSQNEICYISVGGVKLMAEVIKVIGKNALKPARQQVLRSLTQREATRRTL